MLEEQITLDSSVRSNIMVDLPHLLTLHAGPRRNPEQ